MTARPERPRWCRVLCMLPVLCFVSALYAAPRCPTPAGDERPWVRDERPAQLVEALAAGPLRERLARCLQDAPGPALRTIGHRGAPLRYPEHTRESYRAAAQLGAATLECDVAVTSDGALVCRHAQCDLHRTTNILATTLASRCTKGFVPARFNGDGSLQAEATATCCTTDLTEAEFLTLRGRHDRVNVKASTIPEWFAPAAAAAEPADCASDGTLLTHRQSIELFKTLGTAMAPELKAQERSGRAGFAAQAELADQLLDAYREAAVPPERLWLQSFEPAVVAHWLKTAGDYAHRVVWLDGRYRLPGFDHRNRQQNAETLARMQRLGLQNVAPPIWMLLERGAAGPEPSVYAQQLRAADMTILTWTVERSGALSSGGGWYYQTLNGLNRAAQDRRPGWVSKDADQLQVLQVLFDEVAVAGVFSDWPSTTALVDRCLANGHASAGWNHGGALPK